MECSTVYCDVDEFCTLLEEKQIVSRKQHRCGECEITIDTGEKYNLEVTIFDGKFSRHKTCLDCLSVRDIFFKSGFSYGEIKWMLREHINDFMGDISENCIKSLTIGARAMVCDMIEDRWKDM